MGFTAVMVVPMPPQSKGICQCQYQLMGYRQLNQKFPVNKLVDLYIGYDQVVLHTFILSQIIIYLQHF